MESAARPGTDVALKAIYETVAPAGRPADVWRRFAATLTLATGQDRLIQRAEVETAARSLRPGLAAGQMLAAAEQLGVLSGCGNRVAYSATAAEDVARALDLAGASLEARGSTAAWVPVATVPEQLRRRFVVPGLRQTAGILLDIIDHARREIWLTAPFVERTGVEFLTDGLMAALDRGVSLRILTRPGPIEQGAILKLVETAKRKGFGDQLDLYAVEIETSELGSHAKVCLADDQACYLGSANLTAHGLGRNLELGACLHGPDVATIRAALQAIAELACPVTIDR